MRNIDKFSLVAGIIGLLADFLSLAGLLISLSGPQQPGTFIWFLVFTSLVYTILFIDFSVRRFLYRRHFNYYQRLEAKEGYKIETHNQKLITSARIEPAASYITYLSGVPILTFYFMTAADSVDLVKDFFWILIREYPLIAPVKFFLASIMISVAICLAINLTAKQIYKAFNPMY